MAWTASHWFTSLGASELRELTVAAGLAKGLVAMAADLGADTSVLMRRSGLSLSDLEDQDTRIPFEKYVRLTHAAKEVTNDPALPLRYGATVDLSSISVVGLLFKACETIAEAVDQLNRYGEILVETGAGPRRFEFRRRHEAMWLVDTRPHPNHFPELTEAAFARFIGMTRPLWEKPLVLEMHVTHPPPAHHRDYERICGIPVAFGTAWNAMRVDEGLLTQSVQTQPRYAFSLFRELSESLLADLSRSKTTRGRVEGLILPILHTGHADVEGIARRLGISRQTLFRRLKAEEATFEQVMDELRHRLALRHISDGRISVSEIAQLLGFSDRAAFSRAFKRWTGRSPRAYCAEGEQTS